MTPSEVRSRFAAAAAANLSVLEGVLLDAATGATRQAWTTITCKHCERQGRYAERVPTPRGGAFWRPTSLRAILAT